MDRIPMVTLNGDEAHRYAGNVNLSFAHVEGESLLMVRIGMMQMFVYIYIYIRISTA
jgi:cysteine sulfinate desulfinase/cysteine desulfurase-like protein